MFQHLRKYTTSKLNVCSLSHSLSKRLSSGMLFVYSLRLTHTPLSKPICFPPLFLCIHFTTLILYCQCGKMNKVFIAYWWKLYKACRYPKMYNSLYSKKIYKNGYLLFRYNNISRTAFYFFIFYHITHINQ